MADSAIPLRPRGNERTHKPSPRDRLGRPLSDLRISVMDRCNFRCPYCMPEAIYHRHYPFLASDERLSFDEIRRLATAFAGLGVTKLRITGGEPLLRPGLADLIADLRRIDGIRDIALTTNGILLEQHAVALAAAGLDRITVSLDSLDPEVFARMSGGRDGLPRVLAGIRAAREAGLEPIKINTVVQRGVNEHTLLEMLEHFRGSGVIVRFIEFMDVGTLNGWEREQVVPSRELLETISARWPLHPAEANYRGEVASRYLYDDGAGEVGFISSVTAPFCGDCSRARVSSDGRLFTCLFAAHGLDLRTPLREGADEERLRALVCGTWRRRSDRYSELRAGQPAGDRVEMPYIGG